MRVLVKGATPDFRGVTVTATNRDDIATIGISGGAAGSVAVNVAGAVTILNATTKAWIGNNTTVNLNNPISGASTQAVRVVAGNEFRHLGIAGAISIAGGVAVAPGADVRVVNLDTEAWIGVGTIVKARGNIEVFARSDSSIISVAAGIAGAGGVAVGGAVAVIVLNTTTKALIGAGATADSGNNVHLLATDDTRFVMVSVGVGVAGVGAGAGIGVLTHNKTVEASIGAGAVINGRANGAATPNVYSGATTPSGFDQSGVGHGVIVQAVSSENVVGLAIAGGGGVVGIAGAVGVAVITTSTRAAIGADAVVNADRIGAGTDQSVNVLAANKIKSFTLGGGAAGGFVGIAGAVDVGVIKSDVNASIGNGAEVHHSKDIGVYALSKKDILALAVSVGGGFVGVAGSISVWSIGTATSGRYSDRKNMPASVAWAPGTRYYEGDIVKGSDGNDYELRDLAGPNDPDWRLITADEFASLTNATTGDPSLNKGSWNSGTPYLKQQIVQDANGRRYQALTDNTNRNPIDSLDTSLGENPVAPWLEVTEDNYNYLIGQNPGHEGAWSNGHAYVKGDLVTKAGKFYVAMRSTTANDPAVPDDNVWGRVGGDALGDDDGTGGAIGQANRSSTGEDGENGYRRILNGVTDPNDHSATSQRIGSAQTKANAGINTSPVDDFDSGSPSGGTVASIGSGATIVAGPTSTSSPTSA